MSWMKATSLGCRELVGVLQLDRPVPDRVLAGQRLPRRPARRRVPATPPIVRTSGMITVGRLGAERLTGSTRNSCANPSSRRQNNITCSTVRSVRWGGNTPLGQHGIAWDEVPRQTKNP